MPPRSAQARTVEGCLPNSWARSRIVRSTRAGGAGVSTVGTPGMPLDSPLSTQSLGTSVPGGIAVRAARRVSRRGLPIMQNISILLMFGGREGMSVRATDAGGGMPNKRRHRPKREEDPLVAIDGARVRAAIEWKGFSVNAAAGRIDVSQQTLDSIVRGKTKRCYKGLRESLAKLLDLPAAWLGGETDLLPSLTTWLPYPRLRNQPPRWVDEDMRTIRPPAEGDLTQRTTLPPRYQLAAHDLSKRIAEAWKRDIKQGKRDAKAALSQLAVGRWKKNPWDRAMMLVTRLVSAFWWRRLFLKPAPLPAPVDPTKFTDDEWRALGEGRPAEGIAVEDQFAAAAVSALTITLGPWFAGERELNYEGFVDVLEWASSGFGKQPSSGGT